MSGEYLGASLVEQIRLETNVYPNERVTTVRLNRAATIANRIGFVFMRVEVLSAIYAIYHYYKIKKNKTN